METTQIEPFAWPEDPTPHEAVDRLYSICADLAGHQVPAEILDELRAICRRYLRHLEALPEFQDRLIQIARRLCRRATRSR